MDVLLLKSIKQTVLVDLFLFVYIKTTFTDMKTNVILVFIPVIKHIFISVRQSLIGSCRQSLLHYISNYSNKRAFKYYIHIILFHPKHSCITLILRFHFLIKSYETQIVWSAHKAIYRLILCFSLKRNHSRQSNIHLQAYIFILYEKFEARVVKWCNVHVYIIHLYDVSLQDQMAIAQLPMIYKCAYPIANANPRCQTQTFIYSLERKYTAARL